MSAALLAWVHDEIGDIIAGPVVEHDRVAVSGFVFHSEQYKRPYKTDSTVLVISGAFVKAETLLSATDHFGNKKVFAVSQKYATKAVMQTSHILKCESLGGKKACGGAAYGSSMHVHKFCKRNVCHCSHAKSAVCKFLSCVDAVCSVILVLIDCGV